MLNKVDHKTSKARKQKKINTRGWLNEFFEEHYKWIAIISGLVVSATLSVKEALHEKAKDFSDAVSAEVTFERSEGFYRSDTVRLDELLRETASLSKPAQSRKGNQQGYTESANDMEVMENDEAIGSDISALYPLIQLADNRTFYTTLERLEDKQQQIIIGAWRIPKTEEERRNFREKALVEYEELDKEVQEFSLFVMSRVKWRKERLEALEHVFGFISYFIIIVCISLSLISKAFDHSDKEAIEVASIEA